MTAGIRSFYSFNGQTYCEPCVWKAAREAREQGLPADYVSLTDKTICARCGADNGTTDFPLLGAVPFCPKCGELVTKWPYPQWLKIALACLLGLLVFALAHGRKYFRAGRSMYIGERMVEEHRYQQALPYLQETLRVAPESDKAVLLTAKAALMVGDIETAQKALNGHKGGHFEHGDSAEFKEVDELWKRAIDATGKAEEASKLLSEDGNAVKAANLMRQAASIYPQSSGLRLAAESYEESAAFDRHDYDLFLSMAQKHWSEHSEAETAAVLSSALACKYATTGEQLYKQQSEEMLAKAGQLAQSDPEARRRFEEYAERIRYRLDTRNIIGTAEYNRRFRKDSVAKR